MHNDIIYARSNVRGAVTLMVLWDLYVNHHPMDSFPEITVVMTHPVSWKSDWRATLKSGPHTAEVIFTAEEIKLASKVFLEPLWKTRDNPEWSRVVKRTQEAIKELEAAVTDTRYPKVAA